MQHPLDNMIRQVRRRSRLLVAAHALLWAAAAVVATLIALAGLDWLVRIEDRGLRAIASLILLVASTLLVRRVVRMIRASRWSDVQIAQRVERRYPELVDRFSSAVEFLREPENDARAGSAALRRRVIAQVEADAVACDLSSVTDARPVRRAFVAALCAALVALSAIAYDPTAAATALARLANPLNDVQWPKNHRLAFRDAPTRIASGGTFEAELIDEQGRPLPDEVRIHYRYSDGVNAEETEVEAMQFIDGVMVARRAGVTRPFEYRAEGGDDRSMPWRRLNVVEPPLPRTLNVELDYPDYTGWPSRIAEPHIRALAGTRVQITGESSKPLRSAVVRLDSGVAFEGRIGDDGYRFTIPASSEDAFIVTKSGSWHLDLEDREGFHGGRDGQYELRAIADSPPTVQFESPASNVFVTPRAELPLRIVAKDDLAIRDVSLHFGEQVVSLYAGPDAAADPADDSPDQPKGEVRTVEVNWSLGPLGLSPGVEVVFRAHASDYYPQEGRSVDRRLTVITDEQLRDRLADRQSFVLGELARVVKLQQEARAQVAALEIQLEQVGRLEQGDVDTLQGAGLQQQQVARQLTSSSEGVVAHVDDLLAEMRYNKIDSPDMELPMTELRDLLDRLGAGPLPEASRELTSAFKASQEEFADRQANSPEGNAARMSDALAAAAARQQEVIDSIDAALGELSQWDNYRRFRREIGQLQQDQTELAENTSQTGRDTLAKKLNDLTPQQRADLQKLSQRQFDLGANFDQLLGRMRSMQHQLAADDPMSADTLGDALAEAARQALSGRMRDAARELEQNRIGQAAAEQQEVAALLEQLSDILANRPERQLARRVQKLRAAEAQLADMAARQEGLRRKLRAAREIADAEEQRRELERLTREQKALEEEADRMSRELRRLMAERAGQSAGRAAGRMGQAGQQGQQGNAAGAADQADEAQRDLEEARQQLAEARRQAELDLAQEQLVRMEDALQGMRERQSRTLEETRRYEELRTQRGRLSRAEAATVRDLAGEQAALGAEVHDLSETLASVEVFKFVLDETAADMQAAEKKLATLDTGTATQSDEQRALERIDQVIAALKQDTSDQTEENAGGESGTGGAAGGGGDEVRALAEVKLLRLMQASLNERTTALDARRETGKPPTDEDKREYALLSDEQGRLADLLLDLVATTDERPEDNPESLPELDLGDRVDENKE